MVTEHKAKLYLSHPGAGMCSIPSGMLAFALFTDNNLDVHFHLWPDELKKQKQAEMWTHLTTFTLR